MPKKRKTRKEKIQSEHKRQVAHVVTPSVPLSQTEHTHSAQEVETPRITFSLPNTPQTTSVHSKPEQTKTVSKPIATTISTNEYGYIGTDLVRTALLTGAIVFAELLIRLFFVH